MLLGSAMLGGVAAGVYPDLQAAMPAMSRVATRCVPDPGTKSVQAARFAAFLTLQQTAREIRAAMAALSA